MGFSTLVCVGLFLVLLRHFREPKTKSGRGRVDRTIPGAVAPRWPPTPSFPLRLRVPGLTPAARGVARLPSPSRARAATYEQREKWRARHPRGAPAFSSPRTSPEPAAARVRPPPSASVRGRPGAARGPSPASRRRTPRSSRRCVLTAHRRHLYLVPVLLFRAGEVDP